MEIAARAIPFYAALNYNGLIELIPADPLDAAIIAAFNAHQRTDKSFGPALGPTAAAAAIARFKSLGYSVTHGRSDWFIESHEQDMQSEILSGWASAVREIGELTIADTAAWLTRRRTSSLPGAHHSESVMSIFSRHRSGHAEPTGHSRTALRPRSDAHAWVRAKPDRSVQPEAK